MIGVALYTVLVGADAAVVRTAIMGGLFIIAARFMGRPACAPAGLFAAAVPITSEPSAAATSFRRWIFLTRQESGYRARMVIAMSNIFLGIAWLAGIWLASVVELPLWTWIAIGTGSIFAAIPLRR